MEWKLYDQNNNFIQYVNCQYDSLDVAHWDLKAERVIIDFPNKSAHLVSLEKGDGID